MAIFSTNQARHLYVAKALKDSNVVATDDAGSIAVKADEAQTNLYFEYMGMGGLTRSDLISIKDIMYAKATDAAKMAQELKAVTVTLDANINDGKPISGQDYVLKIAFRQFAGLSDEDIYTKFGMVHATANMSESDFYKALAISLAKNFSRETSKLVKFSLIIDDETDPVEVTASTKADTLSGTYTGLLIDEVEQEWVLGVKPQVAVYFDVLPSTIIADGDEVVWGVAEDTEPSGTVKNGKKIADLEYFCMGERGDIYRNVGWPHVRPTSYMVDPSEEYHTLDIHYAYVGSNESVQKSEKDIIIVCDDKTTLNSIISAINTATGLSITSLT